jgi:glycosyltransferase involved in cell wall biosynthesis
MEEQKDLSVIIPVLNEESNIKKLHSQLENVLLKLNFSFEIVFVDDGSIDNTFNNLKLLNNVKIIKFKKNFGQTPAMGAGVFNSTGKIIIIMDGDLQNDPKDIPKLINKIQDGYDVVSGWRYNRKDTFSKKLFSKTSNILRRLLTNEKIHDSGCSLKAYKRECLEKFEFMGEMHRWIPAILSWKGYKIGEVKVMHHKRKSGKTKYGLTRVIKGFLDLMVVIFWQKYSARPIHIFGGLGVLLFIFGSVLSLYLLLIRIFFSVSLTNKTTPLLAVLLIILGVQFFLSGIMADIAIKNYFLSRGEKNYLIEKIIEK